jgi:CDP-diacylglycerol--glycerol-3-phosphate 3-phosphatidyltransferase
MVANTITLCRLLLTFLVVTLFGRHRMLDIGLIAAIALIFVLDAVDGYVARKRNETSEIGEVVDTIADRIIENIFWIYWTATGAIPVWMPIAVMTRGFLTNGLQRFLGYPKSGWTRLLTRSRISRVLSGLTKTLAFTSLAAASSFEHPVLEQGSTILATIAVVYCLVRGLPFFFLIRKTP